MNVKQKMQKTVLIAGAAGGLGRDAVSAFLKCQYKVFALDIHMGDDSFISDRVLAIQADITDREKLKHIADTSLINDSGLDVLVCAAGLYRSFPVTEEDPAHFNKMMDINMMGTVNLINTFLRPLIKNKGKVIVVSSESYKIQALFQPYMISKAALESYCLSARQELALKGVSLTVIRPGAIGTPLLDWMKSEPEKGKYPIFDIEYRASHHQSVKMVGKITPPTRVASIILKAASSSSPKKVYAVNNNLLLTLASLLPKALIFHFVVKRFRKIKP